MSLPGGRRFFLTLLLGVIGCLMPNLGHAQVPPSTEFDSLVGSIGLKLGTQGRAASNTLEQEVLEHAKQTMADYHAGGPGEVIAQDLVRVARRLRSVVGLGPVFAARNVYDCLTTVSDTSEAWIPCLAEIISGSATPGVREKIKDRYGSFAPMVVEEHVRGALRKSGAGSVEYGFREILRLLRTTDFLTHEHSSGGCRTKLTASWFKKFGSILITSSSGCNCSGGALKSGRVEIPVAVRLKDGSKPVWIVTPARAKYEAMVPCAREAGQWSFGGLWKGEGGHIFRITQEGDSVTARFYRLGADTEGVFQVGEESFRGAVDGKVLTGKLLSRTQREHDPHAKDPGTWSDLRLEISEDGDSMSGRWKVPSYYVRTGELLPESEWEWRPLRFTRHAE